jgi:chaperonin GroEL
MVLRNTEGQHTALLFAAGARKKLYEGIALAVNAVGCTLGPSGKTVLIKTHDAAPVLTKDGVTVSRSIVLRDPVQQMGAELVLEAASRTNDVAGDGTTTATILTGAMISEGMRLLEAGFQSTDVCNGIKLATSSVMNALRDKQARQVSTQEEIKQIGTISANGDETIGTIIADAMSKVGSDGIITVEEAKGMSTTLDVVEGMQFDRGYLSPYFVNDPERMVARYDDTLILVTDKKISSLRELIPLLEKVISSQRSLLIIADDVDGDALQGLVLNRSKANLAVVAIKAPDFGQHRIETLQDICTMTGAKLCSSTTGVRIDDLTVNDLGKCKRIIVGAKTTTLVGVTGDKEALEQHSAVLKQRFTNDVTLSVEEHERLRMRIARLANGVAVIKVGGVTEIEMIERKHRIEDALNATRAAAEEGIVEGGGCALIRAWQYCEKSGIRLNATNDGVKAGIDIVKSACFAPIRRIVSNANESPDVIINSLLGLESPMGYNVASGEFKDMFDVGVIDPVKVTRTALENAASVACAFLSLDAVIYLDKGIES